jgi:hypothetical protein
MPSNRKRFWVSTRKFDKAMRFAKLSGLPSVSALVRGWYEDFLENGTDFRPDEMKEIQAVIPEGIVAQADEKAASLGFTMRDLVMHQIDQIEEL